LQCANHFDANASQPYCVYSNECFFTTFTLFSSPPPSVPNHQWPSNTFPKLVSLLSLPALMATAKPDKLKTGEPEEMQN